MLTITKELRFDAAHRLYLSHLSDTENHDLFGKCSRFHGHTYRLRITVAGPVRESGMIINFTELKAVVKQEILSRYDHADLNELEEYKNCPPTAENMVLYIFNRLQPIFGAMEVELKKIRLYETPDSWAEVTDES